jgi:hypothetical protein
MHLSLQVRCKRLFLSYAFLTGLSIFPADSFAQG